MNNFLTFLFLTFFLLDISHAQNLRSTMRILNSNLREVTSSARSGNNGPDVIEKIVKMRDAALESQSYLPRGLSPSDTDAVQRYNSLFSELIEKITELEVIFSTTPLDKNEAKRSLQEIDLIKKRAHSIFR